MTLAEGVRSKRMMLPERKPAAEARSSQFIRSRRGIPPVGSLLATPSREAGPALASRKESNLDSICMLKSPWGVARSEEHTSELQSQSNLVCRLLLEKKKK